MNSKYNKAMNALKEKGICEESLKLADDYVSECEKEIANEKNRNRKNK